MDFTGTKVLLVDDDLRNIFALRTVLEGRGITVRHAVNGKLALEALETEHDISLVLMDTMMPELDGLSTIRKIRESARFAELPIISLTAKAMQGDREKALESGASGTFRSRSSRVRSYQSLITGSNVPHSKRQ
ncbi:MAG: response regulator [Polyangiaceae bacterium]